MCINICNIYGEISVCYFEFYILDQDEESLLPFRLLFVLLVSARFVAYLLLTEFLIYSTFIYIYMRVSTALHFFHIQ
jgi:hypothetical protein